MKTPKLVTIAFLTFLFLLPFQTVYLLSEPFISGEKWQYGMIGVYFSDLFLISTLAFFLIHRFVLKKYQIPNTKYQISTKILVLFVFWTGLSIFWAGDQMLALYFFVKLLLAVGLFAFVRSREVDMKKIVWVLIFLGVLQGGIGIAQFLSQKSIASSILGMSSYEAYEAGSSVLKIDSGRFLRAYGTFSHPNMLGGFLGVILVLSVVYYVLFIRYEKSWGMARDILFLLTSIIVIFLGLLLTFSRSAWLGVVLGMIILGVSLFFQKDFEVRIRFFKMVVVLGLCSIVFGWPLSSQIFPRFDRSVIAKEGSVTERIQSFRDATVIIGEGNIFLGTGAGNFTAKMIKLRPDHPVWSIQPVHNAFVLIFTELGLVGFLLFLSFLGSTLWQMRHLLRKKENILFGIALIVLLPSLLVDHFLWSSHFGLFFLFLLLSLASKQWKID